MRFTGQSVPFLLLGFLLGLSAHGSTASAGSVESAGRSALQEAEPAAESPEMAAATRRALIEVSSDSPELEEAVRREAERFERWIEGWAAEVVGARPEPPEAKLPGAALAIEIFLLPLTDEGRTALRGLPLEASEKGLVFAGTAYEHPDAAFAFKVPRPEAGRPSPSSEKADGQSWAVFGHRAETVAGILLELLVDSSDKTYHGWPPEGADYMIRGADWLRRSGKWRRYEGLWAPDPTGERDDFADRRGWFESLDTIARSKVELRVPEGERKDARWVALADRLDASVAEMAARIPLVVERPLTVTLEIDHVEQIHHAGAVGEAVVGELSDLHLVFHPEDSDAHRFALATVLVSRWWQTLGARRHLPPWLESGAALWLAEGWYGRPYRSWLPRLAAARVLPTAAELLASQEPRDGSRPLWIPVAAEVVDRLPGAKLGEKLSRPPGAPVVSAILGKLDPEPRQPVPPAPGRGGEVDFLHGISLAMLNGIEKGYHAPALDGRLKRLAGLGADAVSLMPFAYQPEPTSPEMRFLNRSPGSETDIGMISAARRSREAGFQVLWKPQIWLSGSWPGDIRMTSESDWQAWWRVYRRFLVHHAMLAEWSGSEYLSIGVELGKTLDRDREWRQLIAAVRIFFGGELTYSANWYGDFEAVSFWGGLDFLGVDAYYPLADSPDAGREELVRGAREMARGLSAMAEKHGKRILLTEVGYAARRGAWSSPHEEGGDFDEDHQALAYEALFEGLGKPPWLAGVFVWKAFSGDLGQSRRPDFRFLDRPAEHPVKSFFLDSRPPAGAKSSASPR